jgi:uncharacterized protein YdiU (UPF0061 family)
MVDTLDGLSFRHGYAALPERFWQAVSPTPVSAPRLLSFNSALAAELGVEAALQGEAATAMFAGNLVPAGARPIAMAYAGHQFGHFVPQLGDGRAILLGELVDTNGQLRDLQLKGAGPTAFSRNGDGRAAIGPVLREFLVSEAMHAMGIPTTRSLAAVATGEPVFRDGPVPGAVLARVAASHMRIGTFQYFAARGDLDAVRQLADYVIGRHYPELAAHDRPYLALLEVVGQRQAELVARWMHVGFIHGVMNTDNTTLSGETIDYGPCAFLDEFNPDKVFSSIDRHGRYAFSNQAAVMRWNLSRLAECLLPLVDTEGEVALRLANEVINAFPGGFQVAWLKGMRAKLGLATGQPGDETLVDEFLAALLAVEADYTLAFRSLSALARGGAAGDRGSLPATLAMDAWLDRWQARLQLEPDSPQERARAMDALNPAVIPRNHQVQIALSAAEAGDLAPFESLLAAVRRPFDDGPAARPYMAPPAPSERISQTFCGT